ncbi:hypothetical protein SDC9_78170 [bioreactor metagenome]|uniref:Uncharacterized protein n=1 Tax=bioreactor metagenome TaxID=1076179 RepID=A0A644Z085_9ZZZZ
MPGEGVHQRVDRPPKLQIPAKADGEVVQPSFFPVNGQKVGQGLGGVVVAAVSGVDNGDLRPLGGGKGRTLLGVAHGDNVRVTAHGADGVRHRFALCGGGGRRFGKAQHAAAKGQHGGFKAQPRAGGRLKKQRGKLFVGAEVLVFCGMVNNVLRRGD